MTIIARRIGGATANLGAPPGWDEKRDGQCGQLWIREVGNPRQGQGYVESAWEVTPDDIERLKAGQSLIVRIYGWQPAIALYVMASAPPDDAATEPEEKG